jgi:hypothetical protein
VDIPLIVAGSLALLTGAIHGVAGEREVLSRLSPEMLPSSGSAGPRMTKLEIHVSWHLGTIAFFTIGLALVLSGSVLDGDAAEGIALVAAGASAGFAVLALALGAAYRALTRHLAPALLTATAALAWLGVLSL